MIESLLDLYVALYVAPATLSRHDRVTDLDMEPYRVSDIKTVNLVQVRPGFMETTPAVTLTAKDPLRFPVVIAFTDEGELFWSQFYTSGINTLQDLRLYARLS